MQDPLRLPEKEWNGNQVIVFDQLQIKEVVARGGYGTVHLAMIRVGAERDTCCGETAADDGVGV